MYPAHQPRQMLSVGGAAFDAVESREDRNDAVVFGLSVLRCGFFGILELAYFWNDWRSQVVLAFCATSVPGRALPFWNSMLRAAAFLAQWVGRHPYLLKRQGVRVVLGCVAWPRLADLEVVK